MMGFFATLAGRVWYTSLMPPWWSVHSNNVFIGIGFIATIDKIASGLYSTFFHQHKIL
jgi:hypothetical protein